MMIEDCLDLTNTLTLIVIVLVRLKHYANRHSFHSDTLFWLRAKRPLLLNCYESCGEAAKTILAICLTRPWIEPAMSHTLLSIKKCATISKYLVYVATIYIIHMHFYINGNKCYPVTEIKIDFSLTHVCIVYCITASQDQEMMDMFQNGKEG